jgi:hypothetical protein
MLVVLLLVLRQVGMVYLGLKGSNRLGEAGMGPEVGALVTGFEEQDDRSGERFEVPSQDHDHTLLLIVSGDCITCHDAVSAVASVERPEHCFFAVLSSGNDADAHALHGLIPSEIPFATNPARVNALGVDLLPLGLMLDRSGLVEASRPVSRNREVEELLQGARHPDGIGLAIP